MRCIFTSIGEPWKSLLTWSSVDTLTEGAWGVYVHMRMNHEYP